MDEKRLKQNQIKILECTSIIRKCELCFEILENYLELNDCEVAEAKEFRDVIVSTKNLCNDVCCGTIPNVLETNNKGLDVEDDIKGLEKFVNEIRIVLCKCNMHLFNMLLVGFDIIKHREEDDLLKG